MLLILDRMPALWNHWKVWVGRELQNHLVNLSWHGKRHHPIDHIAQSLIQHGLEHFQGWRIHSSSGQPISVPLFRKRCLFHISNLNLLSFTLKLFSLVLPLQAVIKCLSPSFLWLSFIYWNAAIRCPWSLLSFRLNSPNFISLSFQQRCSSPLTISVALLWTWSTSFCTGDPRAGHRTPGKLHFECCFLVSTCLSHPWPFKNPALTLYFQSSSCLHQNSNSLNSLFPSNDLLPCTLEIKYVRFIIFVPVPVLWKENGKENLEAVAALASALCWRVLAFTVSLGYAPSENHYFYLVIRPKDPSGIQNTDRHRPRLVGRQTQLAHDWLANATSLVPFETPLSTSLPQTHTPFTCHLITPQY